MSCPEFLDASLRPAQKPVDVAAVGVGCHLRRDPGDQTRERPGQRSAHAEPTLEGREAHLHLLAYRRPPVGLLGRQQDAGVGELFTQRPASVSQVSQEPPRYGALLESPASDTSSSTSVTSAMFAAVNS
jgi:hypothetical protein